MKKAQNIHRNNIEKNSQKNSNEALFNIQYKFQRIDQTLQRLPPLKMDCLVSNGHTSKPFSSSGPLENHDPCTFLDMQAEIFGTNQGLLC